MHFVLFPKENIPQCMDEKMNSIIIDLYIPVRGTHAPHRFEFLIQREYLSASFGSRPDPVVMEPRLRELIYVRARARR